MATLWKRKLSAWLGGSTAKALALLQDADNTGRPPAATTAALDALRLELGLDLDDADADARAALYAGAADRPQWPWEVDQPRPAWAHVRFIDQPLLVHPLSAQAIPLGRFTKEQAARLAALGLEHLGRLVERRADGTVDERLTLLALWRFGPSCAAADAAGLGDLWRLLPADTRGPDASLWQQVDVASALAGALADGAAPALLALHIGPVRDFIDAPGSLDELEAGAQLLRALVGEALSLLCERLGPDAVLTPSLRGAAEVDRWLLRQAPHWRARLEGDEAATASAAALPNGLVAIVPAHQAQALAQEVAEAVRERARQWALAAAETVFLHAGRDAGPRAWWRTQVDAQMQGFPEVHWACADWPVAAAGQMADATGLRQALQALGGQGLFDGAAWAPLTRELRLDGVELFKPNAGVLFPAVHDLAGRALAADKVLSPFEPLSQAGYRCTHTGAHEWLTDDPALLALPPGARAVRSPWSAVAGRLGLRPGEHLGARATLRRLWPLLSQRLREPQGGGPLPPAPRARPAPVANGRPRRQEPHDALIRMACAGLAAWSAGQGQAWRHRFVDSWHPQVRAALQQRLARQAPLRGYAEAVRPPSALRQAAVAAVLSDFHGHVAPHLVERVFQGRLLHAGGDGLLARVPVAALLPCLLALRAAYAGVGDWPALPGYADLQGFSLRRGGVSLGSRLLPMMGSQATACLGAVIAHPGAPLPAVLAELDGALQRAQRHAGGVGDAWCVRLLAPGQGGLEVAGRLWRRPQEPPPLQDTAPGLLLRMAQALGQASHPPRTAALTAGWLAALPPREALDRPAWSERAASHLATALRRAGVPGAPVDALARLAWDESAGADAAALLEQLLALAAFLAREALPAPLAEALP